MPERRLARGGTLVVGGGFAGAYVARLLGRAGATIVNPDNYMLYTPLLPEAASGSLEPRHVVVPLRQMCPHAELLLGGRGRSTRRIGASWWRLPAQALSSSPTTGSWSRSAPCRVRSRSPAWPSTACLQGSRGRDPAPQPRPARARGGRCGRGSGRDEAPPRLRVRGRGLRGRRGARGAVRPRPRGPALLPAAAGRAAAVGARRRGPEDPAPRSRAASATTRRGSSHARGVEIHVATMLASVDEREAVLSNGTADPDDHARLDGRA